MEGVQLAKFAVKSKGEKPVLKEEISASRKTATSFEGMARAVPRDPVEESSHSWGWGALVC